MTTSEQRRLTNWRLKMLQAAKAAGNVARTCRHFGICLLYTSDAADE